MNRWQSVGDHIDFLPEDFNEKRKGNGRYKILISDDEQAVHEVTKLVLKGFTFEGRSLEFIDAYSGEETLECFIDHKDIAVLFLDVVMEDRQTGLDIVKKIRDDLGNHHVRIVLRTGQPGDAPEQVVIRDYDINDYRLKTEMTAHRLETATYVALRNYRDLMKVERNRMMHEKLFKVSGTLFAHRSINEFFNHVLTEIAKMTKVSVSQEESESYSGFAAIQNDYYKVIAASGAFTPYIGKEIEPYGEIDPLFKKLEKRIKVSNKIFLVDGGFIIYCEGNSDLKTMLFIEGDSESYDFELITLFLTSFSIALDNYLLNNLIQTTQEDIIYALGETVENRFEDTGNHVKRTSEMMFRFSTCLGMTYSDGKMLSMASTLHDLGKIVIPDSILKKPGKLTSEEYELMKAHSTYGYDILCSSELPLLKVASEVALYHHEKYDGSGYPDGLKGEGIPKNARIMSIVDAFDTMTNIRIYKEAITIEEAIQEVLRCKGTHFDPELAEIFLENMTYIVG